MRGERTANFFTLGVPPNRYHLPHPPLGLPVILLIRKVLLRAFAILREQRYPLPVATEDEITAALRSVIENDLRQTGKIIGFSKRTYEPVIRQGQWANYNGTVLTKAPDLCFKLRDGENESSPVLSEFDAIFIECKPVDRSHSAGGKYCDDGLIRFVRGDYAWAMQEGVMLAYARHGRTIEKHLMPAMSEAARIISLKSKTLPELPNSQAGASCGSAEAVHISQHGRDFPWPDGKGQASAITVYHLWHSCD